MIEAPQPGHVLPGLPAWRDCVGAGGSSLLNWAVSKLPTQSQGAQRVAAHSTSARHSPFGATVSAQGVALGATAAAQGVALSFVEHVRYTYARTALLIPTPSAVRSIGLGRVGDDL